MDWLQIVILSLVQGISEFLPVSSSAHLILVPVLTEWEDQGLAFDVALHLGSLLAVVLYFHRDLAAMTGSWLRSLQNRQPDEDARVAWAVLFGTIPVGLAGLAFKDTIETVLRSPLYLAAGLIVFGIVLAWADLRHRGDRTEAQINWKDVLVIGCAQALALFPGTSRSGITITAALFMGMNREAASRFSFLLSIPVIVLASGLQIRSLLETPEPIQWGAMAAGIALSGISAYLCIHYFLAFIKRIGMMPFVAYRIILGVILIGVFA
ncbi:undecaprenyl-diphosphatase [Marinobacter segnicrescens]|uniref:Undecaprenyl-diphosphatase n=1 Tax=Marinobacter segnicrescens TaxID=430453 RepID=A0A1I0C8B1_9GAMM|nr:MULTISPECIES: undecaprenyl-diphosphate phosphatase [Marinobacter]UZD64852.1 undecaprenyl-diphosphate phosphatase [Marinobacter sp. AN1]SET15468.1 undecaprenyl-diphosphatase [Marinobacter segnicrescens]